MRAINPWWLRSHQGRCVREIEASVYHRRMDGTSSDVAAFILAGGKSTRMGADKAFVDA